MAQESGTPGGNPQPSDDPLLIFAPRTTGLSRPLLRRFALRLQAEVAGGRPFCCRITNDAELRRLNLHFRAKDEPTDVLSFPTPSPGAGLGDLAISIDRARQQAVEWGHDAGTEVRILLLHGVLHLLGHDHETDGGRMRRLELRWRKALDLPSGLIERSGSRRPAAAKKTAGPKRPAGRRGGKAAR